MRALMLVGFPESLREVREDRSATFGAWGALAAVEDFSPGRIFVTYSADREETVFGADAPKPPLHFNMSGCSGGLALMIAERDGLTRWFPVGTIISGAHNEATGGLADLDIIRLARLSSIMPNGSIRR